MSDDPMWQSDKTGGNDDDDDGVFRVSPPHSIGKFLELSVLLTVSAADENDKFSAAVNFCSSSLADIGVSTLGAEELGANCSTVFSEHMSTSSPLDRHC